MAAASVPRALPVDSDADVAQVAARPTGWRRVAGGAVVGLLLIVAGVVVHQKSAAAGLRSATRAASTQEGVILAETAKEHEEEEKQQEEEKEPAKKACKTAHADDEPGLFCWAVMFASDEALIKSQFTGRAGMFACNDYAVISQEETLIGKDDCGEEFKTWQQDLPAVKKGSYGVNAETSSWLNVPVFMPCWDLVIKSGKVWEQDFTVKLDPDAVFFPERLGAALAPHKGKPIFTTDCRFWSGDPVGKLFGAIEVLSKQAMGAYKGNVAKCKDLPWQGWGEDMWMQKCMDACSIPAVGLFDQVSDGTCPLGGYAPCSDQKAVFHPKKDAGQWWECWKQSTDAAPKTVVAKK